MEKPSCLQQAGSVDTPGDDERCQSMPALLSQELVGNLGAIGWEENQPWWKPQTVPADPDYLDTLVLEEAESDVSDELESRGLDYLTLLLDEPKTISLREILSNMGQAKPDYACIDVALVEPLLGKVGPVEPEFSWTETEIDAAVQLQNMQVRPDAPSFDNVGRSKQPQEPQVMSISASYGNVTTGHPQPEFPDPCMYSWGDIGTGISEPLLYESRKTVVEKSSDDPLVDVKNDGKAPSIGLPEQSSGLDAVKVKDTSATIVKGALKDVTESSTVSVKRALKNLATGLGYPSDDSDVMAYNDKKNDGKVGEDPSIPRSLCDLSWVAVLLFFLLVVPGVATLRLFLHHQMHVLTAGTRATNEISRPRYSSPPVNVSSELEVPQMMNSAAGGGGGSIEKPSPETGIGTGIFPLASELFVADREMPKGASASLLEPPVGMRGGDQQNVLRIRLVNLGKQRKKNRQQFSFVWETLEVFSLPQAPSPLRKCIQCPEDFSPEWIDENGPTKFLHHPLHSVNYQEGKTKLSNIRQGESGSGCICRRCGPTPKKPAVHRRHGFPLDMVTSAAETHRTLMRPSSDEVSVRGTVAFNQHNDSTGSQQEWVEDSVSFIG